MGACSVLVIRTTLRPEERRICESLEQQGVSVKHCAYRDTAALLEQSTVPVSGLVLFRTLSHADAREASLRFARAGWQVMNHPDAINTCTDKIAQALLWQRHGIPAPRFRLAFTKDEIPAAVAAFDGGMVVVKRPSGSWGNGMARFCSSNTECLETLLSMRPADDGGAKPLLFQEYVEKGDHDFRVVIVGHEPVLAYRRISEDWKCNCHLGARIKREPISDDIAAITRRVVEAVGPGIYGLDLMREQRSGRLLVIELNQNPEFASTAKELDVDVAGPIARYVASKVRPSTGGNARPGRRDRAVERSAKFSG